MFYTGAHFEEAEYTQAYADMVDALLRIQEKWNIEVVDLWNDAEMTAIYGTDLYHTCMSDEVHPGRAGYTEWWTPAFERAFTEMPSR